MEYYGRGPLRIAKFRDASLLWRRAEQIAEVLDEASSPLLMPVCLETLSVGGAVPHHGCCAFLKNCVYIFCWPKGQRSGKTCHGRSAMLRWV